MSAPTCGECWFWQPHQRADGADYGACHRSPPRNGPPKLGVYINREWPETRATDWCGEFQPKDPTP